MIFDEIDTGIGGETAQEIKKILESLARKKQVIVITHNPVIASSAAHHLAVRMEDQAPKIVEIRRDDRTEEIARMLGERKGKTAKEHARTLLGLK